MAGFFVVMYYNESTVIFFNGDYLKIGKAGVNPYCQNLHYGTGAFEGIRAYKTQCGVRIFKAREHFLRLIQSCRLLGIPYKYSVEEMIEASYELLRLNELEEAYLRPIVSSGPNMKLQNASSSDTIISAWGWDMFNNKSLSIKISSYCRPHPKSIELEAKACGYYVNSVLAGNEAKAKGFDDALLLDHEGFLAEGPGANLFFEKDGRLYTPANGNILAGITRQTIIDISKKLFIPVESGKYRPVALMNADSAFYCGTGAEITPIKSVDGYVFPKPWNESVGKEIQDVYFKLVREEVFQDSITII